MPSFASVQESFAGGVISPALRYKASNSVYAAGLADCVNGIISREGSVVRRPSSRHVLTTNGASKLLRFTAISGLEWLIELRTDKTVRFFTQQAFLKAPKADTPLSLSGLPYAAGELAAVQTISVGNQVYLLHPNHTPRQLTYNPSVDPQTTVQWALSAPSFSGAMAGGKPAVGAAYGQRLVFSGFADRPGRILFSRTPDENGALRLTDFTTGTDADHALDFTTARAEAIFWLLERDSGVAFGTHSGIYVLSSRSADQALNGTNAEVKRQSPLPIGVLAPQSVDQAFFIAPNSLRDVLIAEYSFEKAGIQTASVAVQASHLFAKTIQAMEYSQAEGLLWLLVDRQLVSLSFWRETQVRAFSRHMIGGGLRGGGIVHSMAVVNGAIGDQLWLCIERDGTFSIEFMQFNEVLAMPHHLDGAVYKDTAGKALGGLQHLNGKAAQVVSDRGEETQTIANGTASIAQSSAQMAAGYAFETRIDLLPPKQTHQSLRNSERTALLTSIELAVTASSGFAVFAQAQGASRKVEGYSGVHQGGVGTADFATDALYHANLPSDLDPRGFVRIASTSARPLNVHQITLRGEVD